MQRESAFCLFSFSIALVSFFPDLRKKKRKMPILTANSRPRETGKRFDFVFVFISGLLELIKISEISVLLYLVIVLVRLSLQ